MGKKESASRLVKALGKTKKEQMAKLYPKVKGDIRGKGPYVRGTIGKKGASDFLKRRAAVAGTKATKSSKLDLSPIASGLGAGAIGYAVGKGWHKKIAGAVTKPKRKETTSHQDKARKMADEAVKKQKKQKSDEGRRHDEKMKARRNKMKKHHSD